MGEHDELLARLDDLTRDSLQDRVDAAAAIRELRAAVLAEGGAREPVAWNGPATLQIDSYATGQKLSSCHIVKNSVKIAITDGCESWEAEVNLPKGFRK